MSINESKLRRIIREETHRVLLEYVPSSTSDETMAKVLFEKLGPQLGFPSRAAVELAVHDWQVANAGDTRYSIPTANLFAPAKGLGARRLIPPDATLKRLLDDGTFARILSMNSSLGPEARLHLILHHWGIAGRRGRAPMNEAGMVSGQLLVGGGLGPGKPSDVTYFYNHRDDSKLVIRNEVPGSTLEVELINRRGSMRDPIFREGSGPGTRTVEIPASELADALAALGRAVGQWQLTITLTKADGSRVGRTITLPEAPKVAGFDVTVRSTPGGSQNR